MPVRKRGREVGLSLLLALAVSALALAGAGSVVLVDLDALRVTVRQYFGVDAARIELPPAEASGGDGGDAADLLRGGDDAAFGGGIEESRAPRPEVPLLSSDVKLALPRTRPAAPLPPPPASVLEVPDAAARGEALPKRLPAVGPRTGGGPAAEAGPAVPAGAVKVDKPPESAAANPAFAWNPDADAPPPLAAGARPAAAPVNPPPPPDIVPPRLPAEADVTLRPETYPSLDDELDTRLWVYRPGGSEAGYFRLDLNVKPDSGLEAFDKDVLFLVDVSGSIPSGEIREARKAAGEYFSRLPAGDRWNVTVFSQTARSFSDGFLPASAFAENRNAVERFIGSLPGERRTNVYQAVETMLADVRGARPDRPVHVFLVSDGVANDQVAETRRIVTRLRRADRTQFAVFPFDAGGGGNPYLLTLLAVRSRGEYFNEPSVGRMSGTLVSWCRSLDAPVLMDVVVNRTGIGGVGGGGEIYPEVLPNLYRGRTMSIWGRIDAAGDAVVRVAGRGRDGMRAFYFSAGGGTGTSGGPEVARGWALGRAHEELARLSDGPDPARAEALRQLAERFGLTEITGLMDRREVRRAFYGR